MSKFVQNASYYLDDKDLADLFKAQNVSPRFLLKFGRRHGMFFSEKAKKETLVRALSMAPTVIPAPMQLSMSLSGINVNYQFPTKPPNVSGSIQELIDNGLIKGFTNSVDVQNGNV